MAIRLFVLIWALVFSVGALATLPIAVTDPSGTEVLMGVRPPRYLYHWVDYETLARIAQNKKFSEPWDRFGDLNRSGFNLFWSQFKSKDFGGLFTWTHPVLGMKGGPNENYGQALIRIELDVEKVKALQVTTADKPYDFSTPLDVTDIDLVHHNNNGLFQEWVILDPGVIKNFTADVDVLKPILEKELKRLKDPSYKYSPDEIHFLNFKQKGNEEHLSYAIRTLTDLIESNRDAIPSYFRRDEKGNPIFAKWVSGKSALPTTILAEALRRFKKHHPPQQRSLESIRASLNEIDLDARASSAALEAELKLRILLYASERPAEATLKEFVNLLPLIGFGQFTFIPEAVQKITARLRGTPFDPYRSILDILYMSDSGIRSGDTLADKKLEYFIDALAKSDLGESFKKAFERDYLGNESKFEGKGKYLSTVMSKASVGSCRMLFAN